ncbi:MAG TPA: DUF5987 family protein [Thermoleophilaceae bacterium]|nr:DUF5987 family protein [Thermoleophilaceae bacterium]
MGGAQGRGPLAVELSRRDLIARASTLGLGALVLAAGPAARLVRAAPAAAAGLPSLAGIEVADATLQAFADTLVPGRRATRTDLGDPIDPRAIAGVDSAPGAVEADALRLYHAPLIGFDALEPAFLADLSARALATGGSEFLLLGYDKRVQAVMAGLDFSNPTLTLWEAAAAVPFTAFCAAAEIPGATSATASGYRVMGYPGAAPDGYQQDFGYGRPMSPERTRDGNLP